MRCYSIAIDGPAASGKSTAAKLVSKKFGFLYVDTGAMYRAFTLHMLNLDLDCKSSSDALIALKTFKVEEDRDGHVYLNGVDVTNRVRETDISNNVSYACAHKEVREECVRIQQEMSLKDSVCMDGRDIGTVVLKNADLKIYQVASVEARAKRRYLENIQRGIKSDLEEIKKDIERRDYIDSHRENSPLRKADDAILLDTSDMTIEEEVNEILRMFKEKVGDIHGN